MPRLRAARSARPARTALSGLLVVAVTMALPGGVASTAPATVSTAAAAADTGSLDTNRDGRADVGSYGPTNRGLSVGEQGAQGNDLRYLLPVQTTAYQRQLIAAGAPAHLELSIWRADALSGRRLVVTALPGGLTGRADHDRTGLPVTTITPKAGPIRLDVADSLRRLGTSTVTFRFQLDRPGDPADRAWTQVNIATADSTRPADRPRLVVGTAALRGVTTSTTPATTTSTTKPPSPTSPTTKPTAPPTTAAPGLRPAPTPTTAAPAPSPRPPATGTTPAPAGWRVVWSDEFDGSRVDASVWKPYHSTYGDGNNELACLTPNNVAVGGGQLTITARQERITCPNGSTRDYSSGFLGSRETGTYFPRYGRFEMRAKLPHAQGMWPAFWLRHRNGAGVAEVDVMEYFHSQVPGRTTGTLHLDGRSNISKRSIPFEAPTATPGWHTWAVEIEPVAAGVQFTFLLDGAAYHSYTDTQHHWASAVDPNGTWDMAINMAVGGKWTGHPAGTLGYLDQIGRCAQGGTPPSGCATTGIRRANPSETYQVDWVRYYQR